MDGIYFGLDLSRMMVRMEDFWTEGETLMYELMGLYIFGQINLFKLLQPS